MKLCTLTSRFRIPLERGRDIALQYGVAPLLAPLFDFVPNANPMGGLPASLSSVPGLSLVIVTGAVVLRLVKVLHLPPSCRAQPSDFSTKGVLKAYSRHLRPVCLPRILSPMLLPAHIL